MSSANVWQQCLNILQEEYPPQQFNTWLRPLQAEANDNMLILLAPNRFVVDWVKKNFYSRIQELVCQISADVIQSVSIEIGTKAAQAIVVTPQQRKSLPLATQKLYPRNQQIIIKTVILIKNSSLITLLKGTQTS